MSIADPHVVIVGTGHAGDSAAALLRQYGFDGRITLLGAEPVAPYHRPPLSKAWLKSEATSDTVALKSDAFYVDQCIDLRLNATVASLDRMRREITLESSDTIGYDRLILATGARARPLDLPGSRLEGVLSLRAMADAERLRRALALGGTLAVIGGGFIGLEVAAAARALGVAVCVIERESRLLARVASSQLSDFYLQAHRNQGVTVELAAEVSGFEERDGSVAGVRLSDGRVIACNVALVGVGALPNDEIARNAGLECGNGVIVDTQARTSDPDIFAIGDLSLRPLPVYGRMFRLESVPGAVEQAKQAASAITGRPAPAAEVPWFWSDQYGFKLQIAGLSIDADTQVLRGDPTTGRFAIFHLKGACLRAVEAVNSPGEFAVGKKWIASATRIAAGDLRNRSIPMTAVGAA